MDKIIIVGGGASGIVCAIHAKNNKNQVLILERNKEPLKKLLMTGNGRCNYMNEVYNKDCYYSTNIDIVDKIISTNNINLVKSFFEELGIIPNIKNGYYYPYSNCATTIKDALLLAAKEKQVEIITEVIVEDIKKENDMFIVKTNNKEYTCNKLVLGTGSCAYPKTGSDGMGYNFLKKLNHHIIKPLPALVQLNSNFPYSKDWDGVRCSVTLELFEDGNYITKEAGELQLTSYGLSGICIFNLSNIITRGLDNNKKYEIHINFVPFIETLITTWMDTYSKKCSNKNISELLEGFLNKKIVNVILKYCKIEKNIYYQDLDNNKKLLICKSLRSFPINITSTKDYNNSQICNGGVPLTEINPNTFESTIVKNLYIIGELLDMNGNCGGYNLTTCWISGILSGTSIGEEHD